MRKKLNSILNIVLSFTDILQHHFHHTNAEVELINPVADTVANANYRGADVDWYVKADDIVLKSKENHNIDSPQNRLPQGQPKK